MLSVLPIPTSTIILIMNIVFIAIILLCGLVGFIRGTRKSLYFLIWSTIVFVGGWLFLTICSRLLLKTNFGFLNINIAGVKLTTPLEFVKVLVVKENSSLAFAFEKGTYTYEFMIGVVSTILVIVGLILLNILAFSFFLGLGYIFWLIFRPKTKVKKAMSSRLGGLGIGIGKGLLYTLMIGSIFAGIGSVTKSIDEFAKTSDEVMLSSEITLSQEDSPTTSFKENIEQYSDIFEIFTGYRKKTITGIIFGALKFGKSKTTIDEALFDVVVSTKAKNGRIRYRKDIAKVTSIINNKALQAVLSEDFNEQKLFELDKKDLRELVDTLSSLDVIKVAVPVAIECAVKSGVLEEAFSENPELANVVYESYPKLIAINYSKEFKNIGYIAIDVIELIETPNIEEIDLFDLDKEIITKIFDEFSQMQTASTLAPIAFKLILSNNEVVSAIENTGLTVEELGLNDENINIIDEFMKLKDIYFAASTLGLHYKNKTFTYDEFDYTKVDQLTDAIFSSTIISNAFPAIAKLGYDKIPEEYKQYIVITDFKNVNWQQQLSSILSSAGILIKCDIIDNTDNITVVFNNLDDKMIVDLGMYLSNCSIIVDNLDRLIDGLMKNVSSGELTIIALDKTQGEVWDKNEITSILKAFKIIVSLDFVNNDVKDIIANIPDATIKELGTSLSSSKFFLKNFDAIINNVLTSAELPFTIESLDKAQGEVWTKDEMISLLMVAKEIFAITKLGSGVTIESIKLIPNDAIETLATYISSSTFMKKNINNIISYISSNYSFNICEFNNDTFTKEELYSFISSLRIIAIKLGDTENSVAGLFELTDNELDIILSSKLITETIINALCDGLIENDVIKGIQKNPSEYTWEDVKINTTINKDNTTLKLNRVSDAKHYIILKNGMYFTSTTALSINLDTISDYTYSSDDSFVAFAIVGKGELRKLFGAIRVVNIDDIISSNIDLRSIMQNLDTILDSHIIKETLVELIKTLDKTNGGILDIPSELMASNTLWHESEILDMFNALDALCNISSSTTPIYINDFDKELENIYIENVVNNKDTLLKSKIISSTLRCAISELDESVVVVPTTLKSTPDDWYNTYDESGNVLTYGEISKLFEAIYLALGLTKTSKTNISTINISNVKLSNITNDINRLVILESKIICATLKDKIISLDATTINLPKNYDDINSPNYIVWENTHNNSSISYGEINNILWALDKIMGDATLDDLSNMNFAIIFNESMQDIILKSKIISETIINKLSSTDIQIPSINGLDNIYDRTSWFNEYNKNGTIKQRNELSKLINAISLILSDSQKEDLTSINIDDCLNNIVSTIKDDKKATILFSSYVVSETLYTNIKDYDIVKNNATNAFVGYGLNASDRNNWYQIDDGRPVKKELWNLISATSIILGTSSLDSSLDIDINSILSNNDLMPTYDQNYMVTSSQTKKILDSMIIENILANAVGDLSLPMINTPDGGYKWYRYQLNSEYKEHDLETFLNSYIIINKYIDLDDITNMHTSLASLSIDQINDLGAGMVISRTFRGSIASIINSTFEAAYNVKAYSNSSMLPWDSVKFVQEDYDNITLSAAHNKFVQNYQKLITEFNK